MIALAALHTGDQFAFLSFPVTTTTQAHVLFQGELVFGRTQDDGWWVVIVFASLVHTISSLQNINKDCTAEMFQ